MIKTIKSIILKNFQSHKLTVVDLSTGVNIFSGESNNGKTAVLRAVNWVITNRPAGIGFVSTWAKETNSKGEQVIKKGVSCEVTLAVEDTEGIEHAISRVRTKDDNLYVLDGVKLSAVGASVPTEVTNLLCLKDINVQSQDDGYFFLTLTPGQAAARLNELVHLDTIDKAFEFIRKKKLALNAISKEWEASLAENRQKRDGLSHIPALAEDIAELTAMEDSYTKLDDSIWKAQDMLEVILDVKMKKEHLAPATCEQDIEKITDLLEDYTTMKEQVSKAASLLSSIKGVTAELNHVTTVTQDEVDMLTELIDKYNDITSILIDLQNIQNTISLTKEELLNVDKELKELHGQLPDICPTCNQPINREIL